MSEPPELHPEDDPVLLRAELDACRTEINRLRVESRRLHAIGMLQRDQIARLETRNTHLVDQRDAAERSARAYKGQATKIKRRVGRGVCPCCNRHFENLERHMHMVFPLTAPPR
ncbi:hypothetical protein [Nitrosomonas sp.]|uniref:hypothetical protein n=1 Tax=Nitrosomonas sp. TaxID=42353 RepID=UPI0025F13BAD|nr:hypothetical protein [Nitrosomonas sp.]MBV6448554.1 hypothetical protein [Nitrosomonas sp.]